VITDLVGLRALHLFKDDCLAIDESLRRTWTTLEPPIAYVRAGDADEMVKKLQQHGFETKSHPAGYRSIHYVLASQPLQRQITVEVQVRTIFEEGWSEIDHRVRYPNFSDNELVDYFLTIFNRMAGSADEMGGFVGDLASTLRGFQRKVADANSERDATLKAMEATLGELERFKKQDATAKATVERLEVEIAKLQRASSIDSLFASSTPGGVLASLRPSAPDSLIRSLGSRASEQNEILASALNRYSVSEDAIARALKIKPENK
jgi:putative GTP pyrophosphokinase